MENQEYNDFDIAAMSEAVKMSGTALTQGQQPSGGPFGAAIYKNGKLIAASYNHVLSDNDPSAHGEVYTIREACKALNTWDLSDCVLYTSCEPCPMCLMTSKWANIGKIYFAATRKDAAEIGFRDDELYEMLKPGVYGIQIKECRDEAVRIMREWHHRFGAESQY